MNLLGRAAFRGLDDPSVLQFPVVIDRMSVFMYNGVHLALSLAIGLIVVLPWWSIVVANASAVVFGALYLSSRRPGVIGRVVPLAA